MNSKDAKILVLDIETSLMEAWIFQCGDNYIRHDDVKKDWHLMSYTAKWYGKRRIFAGSQRGAKQISNDKKLLRELRALLSEADIVLHKNGDRFDMPRINARFVLMGIEPVKQIESIDVEKLSYRVGRFTSHSLAYLSEKVNKKYRKLKHKEFPNKELWIQCEAGNPKAWDCMEKYNRFDILATEELYDRLKPYVNKMPVNLNAYHNDIEFRCETCGSHKIVWRGTRNKGNQLFRRYRCKDCGHWGSESGGRNNLFSKEKRHALKGRK